MGSVLLARRSVKILMLFSEIFEAFCVGETYEIYERYQFNKRVQESSKYIDSYVAALRTLSKTCNYGSLLDSFIHDRTCCRNSG